MMNKCTSKKTLHEFSIFLYEKKNPYKKKLRRLLSEVPVRR
jgi:hypothetical protein